MKQFKPINLKQLMQQKEKFFFFCYISILVLLTILEGSIALDIWRRDHSLFWLIFSIVVLMMAENIVKMFVCKKFHQKIACYVVDFLGLFSLAFLTETNLILPICMLILSEFYLSSNNFKANLAMVTAWEVLYFAMRLVITLLVKKTLNVGFYSETLGEMFSIAIHFMIMVLALTLYRKNEELVRTVEDLNVSNEHLREAYEKIAETTAIEERQKIAKDIHDTAGHSITTVIMQTELAKLLVEKDPIEAKQKIVAANLQAKNALAELRTSVHLLSGRLNGQTLKELMERVILDTSNGTDIAIRSDIDDVKVEEETAIFLCNTLKEGLSNGMRHGKATAFWVELKEDDYAVSFVLSDNGVGMDTALLKEGFGLSGMRTSAESLGGIVRFSSQPGEGFEITVTLPKKQAKEEEHE